MNSYLCGSSTPLTLPSNFNISSLDRAMNHRGLIQAAWNGDVQYLIQENYNNPTVLPAVALEGSETPLHITCYAVHVNFAQIVIKLRQEFCRELNQDGFTPLHIAAACGHVGIVKLLLKVDLGLCLIKGKDRKIPLHLAVVKGKVEVVRELLLASLDSVECMTVQLQTSLHLAVKNNQFEAFQVLIQHLNQFNKEDILDSKDIHGNTILHLAVSMKQYEVVDFLLNGQVKEKMELNALNKSGLTPLDMLLMFQSEAGDREIEEILVQSGARKSENLQSQAAYPQEERPNSSFDMIRRRPREYREFLHFFSYDPSKDSPAEVRNTLLVVFTLIMTATYQIVLSPPGGLWQDHEYIATTSVNTTLPHTAGKSIMATDNPVGYIMLMCANSFGFYTSFDMILALTSHFPMRLEFEIAMYGLFFCYAVCLGATTPYLYMGIIFFVLGVPMWLMFFQGTWLLRYIMRKYKGHVEGEEQGPYIFD